MFRKEMYGFSIIMMKTIVTCFDNINYALGRRKSSITPVNLFLLKLTEMEQFQ